MNCPEFVQAYVCTAAVYLLPSELLSPKPEPSIMPAAGLFVRASSLLVNNIENGTYLQYVPLICGLHIRLTLMTGAAASLVCPDEKREREAGPPREHPFPRDHII
jgi:hypothetical protein